MINLKQLEKISRKDIDVNKDKWLYYLFVTKEYNYNFNHLKSLSELNNKNVLNYVIKSLNILSEESKSLDKEKIFYIEETLKWMDVSKCGTKSKRREWQKKGFDLFVHNIGSYQIYKEETNSENEIIETLIRTHGLIGQYIKGEVNLNKNKDLYLLIEKNLIKKDDLRDVLFGLNKCIIKAISIKLWDKIEKEIMQVIEKIINNDFKEENYYDSTYIIERLSKLRISTSVEENKKLKVILDEDSRLREAIGSIFEKLELWFFDSAIATFSLDNIIKILLIISVNLNDYPLCEHLSFERIMKSIYLDYKGNKVINIYRERIIEKFLKDITIDDIIKNNIDNNHLKASIININVRNTILFSFEFSIQATKLTEFCEIAYETSSLFNKAVFMLYDLFDFRRDQYDRFYNEIEYLKIMNDSLSKKSKILDYISGRKILDVGPGGGALMDLIVERLIDVDVYGIDISANVVEELNKKKLNEDKKWNIIKGDALELSKYIKNGMVDTIIYSSILHELFSYVSFEGKKFNHNTIKKALKEAFDVLPSGGRIIIRDGIMTEVSNLKRIIKFKDKKDINILDSYCNDFKGRKITYVKLKDDEVLMNVNDAMEFLYTYTWGENSYSLEVQEQFGYFTPTEYQHFIKEIFNNKCKIIECLHFLQDGYEEHLLEKIDFYDENHIPVNLPDSTCIIVIQKL